MKELIKENAELAIGIASAGALIPLFMTMLQPGGAICHAVEIFMESIC